MAAPQPLYDLVLLLDSNAADDRRAQILRGVEDAIGKGGEIVNQQDWGMRSLAFEIRHKKDAEYHLLQFHGTAELLAQLDRTLRITDEVVRHRIIKLAPGTPDPPEHRPEPRPAGVGAGSEEVPVPVGGPPAEEATAEEAAPATAETAVAEEAPAEVATEAPAEAPAAAEEAAPAAEEAPAEAPSEDSEAPSA